MNWLDFEVKGQGHDETSYSQKLLVQKCTFPALLVNSLPLKTVYQVVFICYGGNVIVSFHKLCY